MTDGTGALTRPIEYSFEFFPPKSEDAAAGWWRAVEALSALG